MPTEFGFEVGLVRDAEGEQFLVQAIVAPVPPSRSPSRWRRGILSGSVIS